MDEKSFTKWLVRVEELTGMGWEEIDGRGMDPFNCFKRGVSPEAFVAFDVLDWGNLRIEEMEEKAGVCEFISMGPGYREFEGYDPSIELAQEDAYCASMSSRLRDFNEKRNWIYNGEVPR